MGIEIDEPRAKIAAENVRNAGVDHLVTIIAGNALAHDLNGSPEVPPPTHIYLYLVPRGYRALLPLLISLELETRLPTTLQTPTHTTHHAHGMNRTPQWSSSF